MEPKKLEKFTLISNNYILGWVCFLVGSYLQNEGRIYSPLLFFQIAIILWTIDLFRKVKHVKKLDKEFKDKINKKDKEE
jgi:hypothetical protein